MRHSGHPLAGLLRIPPRTRARLLCVTSMLYEVAAIGGLVLAAIVKLLLTYGWKRLSAPKGRQRHRGTKLILTGTLKAPEGKAAP